MEHVQKHEYTTMPAPPLLELKGISKHFGGVHALEQVDLEVRAGQLHVLFGENGAGKSTLINIISGTFAPDDGSFYFDGEEIRGLSPQRARAIGISPIFQEFSLVPSLSVEENLFLGREISSCGVLNHWTMRKRARALLDELGFDLDPSKRVDELPRAQQQMTEIAKALLGNVRLLILDEPTASLTERETGHLFDLIARLKTQNVGLIYVSHRMREIRLLADKVTVLRDGRHVRTLNTSEATDGDLVELMTGRRIDLLFPTITHRPTEVAVDVKNLTLADFSVKEANFHARAGEITGIAGLVGCGKSELVRAIYGLEPILEGAVKIEGASYDVPEPRESLRRGIAYFPADRVAEGLALALPIRENVSMTALDVEQFARFGLLKKDAERKAIQGAMERLKLRPLAIDPPAAALSGGNRQKVMLGRGLTRDLSIFLFDEPSVGIDVGAKLDVYDFMKQLVEMGAAVIVVSSELPEVLALSNRLYVMHQGRIATELIGADKTEQNVLASFFQEHA